jgi:hypothetical protein
MVCKDAEQLFTADILGGLMRQTKGITASIAALLVLCVTAAMPAQKTSSVPEFRLPISVNHCVKMLGPSYTISTKVKPFYLRGDFDGDGKWDYAVLVRHSGQQGLVICRASSEKPILLGAGMSFHNMKDLNFNAWQTHSKAHPVEEGVEAGKPPILLGDAILIEWEESASAIVYWNGKQFVWYQQGD